MLMKLVATEDNEMYIEDAEDLAVLDPVLNASQALLMLMMIKAQDETWINARLDEFDALMQAQQTAEVLH